jgi:MOSC domain-containing protein YiiM
MSQGIAVVSVNVGASRRLLIDGRERQTGIFKEPVAGRVPVRGVSVGDDVQMDRKNHGGPFQAVYLYAIEDYEWWSDELGYALLPGTFGENLTTRGIDLQSSLVGERWRIGTTQLEVTSPRIPCSTLATRMGEPGFVKRFAAAERFGAYAQIAEEGEVGKGDVLEVLATPNHGVTIVDVARAYYARDIEEGRRIYEATGRPEFLADLTKA